MEMLAGTSGYSHKEWVGPFYPEDLPAQEMLRYYAGRLRTVEINNTFYRMPAESVLETWAREVPESFAFSLKAPRFITHVRRLKDTASAVAEFMRRAAILGDKLGVVLFQTPPTLRKDLPRLHDFLGSLPAGRRVALEFRHASWQDDEVHEALRAQGVMLCVSEDDKGCWPFVVTSDCAYLRLRRERYDESDLAAWIDRIAAHPLDRVYIYFKHEGEGVATGTAELLEKLWRARGAA